MTGPAIIGPANASATTVATTRITHAVLIPRMGSPLSLQRLVRTCLDLRNLQATRETRPRRLWAGQPIMGETPGTGRHDIDRHNTGRHNTGRHNTGRHDTGRMVLPNTARHPLPHVDKDATAYPRRSLASTTSFRSVL